MKETSVNNRRSIMIIWFYVKTDPFFFLIFVLSTLKWDRTSDLPPSSWRTVPCGNNTGGRWQSLSDSSQYLFLISAFRMHFFLSANITVQSQEDLSAGSLTHIFQLSSPFLGDGGQKIWFLLVGRGKAALRRTANLMKLEL